MTTKRPQLQYKVVVYPKTAHIYVGIPCPDGRIPAELILPNGHFLTETLRSTWGAVDKEGSLRYRICAVDAADPLALEQAVTEKLESIKAEWQRLLEETAPQAALAKLSIPEWTDLT